MITAVDSIDNFDSIEQFMPFWKNSFQDGTFLVYGHKFWGSSQLKANKIFVGVLLNIYSVH